MQIIGVLLIKYYPNISISFIELWFVQKEYTNIIKLLIVRFIFAIKFGFRQTKFKFPFNMFIWNRWWGFLLCDSATLLLCFQELISNWRGLYNGQGSELVPEA